jgi:hypothetical protein
MAATRDVLKVKVEEAQAQKEPGAETSGLIAIPGQSQVLAT